VGQVGDTEIEDATKENHMKAFLTSYLFLALVGLLFVGLLMYAEYRVEEFTGDVRLLETPKDTYRSSSSYRERR
jgi:hypothetical protein